MKSCSKCVQAEKSKHPHIVSVCITRVFSSLHDVNIRFLLRAWDPAASTPDSFHNLFFLFSDSKHFRILLSTELSHWTAAVSWRHPPAFLLAEVHVSLRCPRVHFHSTRSCSPRSLPPFSGGNRYFPPREGRPCRAVPCRAGPGPRHDLQHVHRSWKTSSSSGCCHSRHTETICLVIMVYMCGEECAMLYSSVNNQSVWWQAAALLLFHTVSPMTPLLHASCFCKRHFM